MSALLKNLLVAALVSLVTVGLASAQGGEIPRNLRGDEARIARGILDGNLIETNFRNHGELSRWNDLPWGVWPRGIGGRHIDGVGIIVAGQVPGDRTSFPQFYPGKSDTTLNPVILTYRDAGKTVGPEGELWGWLPLPGFHNENRTDPITGSRTPVPALSDDPTSWPASWPDRLDNPDDPGWPGTWNGFFGKGVFNADLESYYVMDDHSDMEYAIDPGTGRPNSEYGVFYPSPTDSTMGGLGLQTRVRIFQWANVLAEDVMFILYRITNVGETEHDRLYFAQIMDYGLGNEEGDENAAFDPQSDVAFGWDQDGIGTRPTGGTYDLGYTGFAFLESPARANDNLDNDEDGVVDESRFSGPGTLIEGQTAISIAVNAAYNMVDFEAFNGPLDQRPAYLAGRWWTGDENLDWVGFTDENGNGVWDQGELVNNDVGRDGLGPFDFGYPGPDDGEVDGIPTLGEPNFDELDVDESDQIGLTGFDLNTRPFYESGDNLREDGWLWDRIFNFAQFPLGTKPEAFVADVEPFLLFTSGPVALNPGQTDFFSTAWIFGEDEGDFFKNRRTVQSIFNADYNFAQPPFLPKLTAVPGDGRVTLTWDTVSVASFDRFSQEFDFQGYKLYRGTDPLLSDARTITDMSGTPTFYEPIARWDLIDGIRGPVPVLGGTAIYNLGDDTGLSFFYIDDDVTNGITYYYALVAYDRGFSSPDNPSAEPIDPQENAFNITTTLAGDVTGVSRNAAVVIPRSLTAGFVEGGSNEDLSHVTEGIGSGSISVRVVADEAVSLSSIYRVNFFSERIGTADIYRTTAYEVVNVAENTTLISRTPLIDTTPLIDGHVIEIFNDRDVAIIPEKTGYVSNEGSANELLSLDPRDLDGFTTNWIASVRLDTTSAAYTAPADYELRWTDPADTTYRPPRIFGFPRVEIPVFGYNVTEGRPTDLLIQDYNGNSEFDAGDELIINELDDQGIRKFRYRVRFQPADPANSTPPAPGNKFRIAATRPFRTGDFFQYTVRSGSIDDETAKSELERIAVVPNPYVGASDFERGTQLEGRGGRLIQFIHLPQRCTISIFNIRGERVATIEHDGSITDGSEWWDLTTRDGQDAAYGVYVFHVDAPGIGEHVGKFAIVK
ncbi:MAG TPA: hypothetical protein VMO47_03495 [Rhodothermales bacterium]|nr:hypothetical protein [Rhodothermales bacterium]